jgi:hypothetical protein
VAKLADAQDLQEDSGLLRRTAPTRGDRILPPIALAVSFTALLSMGAVGQSRAKPSEPVATILDAFKTHQIVGIPDPHRNTAIQAFLLSLIRDARFPTVVNDIVVEFGNALYQDAADRFVRGQDVPYETLRKIWLDTTQAQPASDTPQAEETLRTIRAVNAAVARERHLRVLLGDPPIVWDDVKTKADHLKWIGMRETFPASVVQREVLARGRKALLVYGVGHLSRKNPQANFESTGAAASLVSLIEETNARVFNVGLTFDLDRERPEVSAWPAPSLVLLRGTDMGAAPVSYDGPRVSVQGGQIVQISRDQWRNMRMEDQYDAMLYLGPRAAWSDVMVSPALCADPRYVAMRTARMALTEWKSDHLDDYCGKVRPPVR